MASAFAKIHLDDGPVVLKAVAGGGGRGMRTVNHIEELEEAYRQCRSEAKQAFGNGELLVERLLTPARHIEVQIMADSQGEVIHLGERDCSLQRRNQKLIECAPSPAIGPDLRRQITEAALTLARHTGYRNIGTFEFLVDADQLAENPDDAAFYFLEVNPRVQVEHTVTEELMDVDLVQSQLRIAHGYSLSAAGSGTVLIHQPTGLRTSIAHQSGATKRGRRGATQRRNHQPLRHAQRARHSN